MKEKSYNTIEKWLNKSLLWIIMLLDNWMTANYGSRQYY